MASPEPADSCGILGQLIIEVTAAESEAEIYAAVARHLPKLIDCDRASVALLTPDEAELTVFALEGSITDPLQLGTRLPNNEQISLNHAILYQEASCLEAHPNSRYLDIAQLAKNGVQQVMHAPLSIAGKAIGTLNMASRQAQTYGTAELERLQQISSLTAATIERLRLLQKTQASMERHRHHAKRLAILNEIGRQLSSATTEQAVFHIVADAIERVLAADRVSYVVIEPDGKHCSILALTGNDVIPKTSQFPLAGSGMAAVLEKGGPMTFPDFTDSTYREHKMLLAQGLCMGWSVPIQVSGHIIGILNAATQTRWSNPEEALTLLNTLGRFMGTTFERIQAQKDVDATLNKLEHQASHDDLTGLPNRDCLRQSLDEALQAAKADQDSLAVFFVDLDRFKQVNDGLSHSIGDQLLRAVAKRMRKRLRPTDLVARTGGDEFVVLLPKVTGAEMGFMLARRLLTTLREPFQIEGHKIQIGGSIGMSLFPEHGCTSTDLMKQADIAMYAAKRAGRDTCRVYAEAMSAALRSRLDLERDLQHAIPADEFILVFQPQFNLATGQITSIEALIRWQHPTRGWVSPGEFIPIAEDSGLIGQITSWVLDEGLRALASLRPHHPELYVSINISAQELLTPVRLTQQVETALSKYQLPGQALELELTERVFLEHAEAAGHAIKSWKKQGIQLAIDDFGIGFSSLNYLLNLPMDTIKIDRSFIQAIQTDPRSQGIVKTILALGENLSATCIAEGVETAEQCNLLRQWGCQRAQGFGLAKPMAVNDLYPLLQKHKDFHQHDPQLTQPSLVASIGDRPFILSHSDLTTHER